MEWEEKQTWDEQVKIMKKQILPQMASSFRPDIRAWRKAPENWPRLGQTNADMLTDWLKFEKQVRADEQFADAEPSSRKSTPVLYPIQTLEERFSTCRWRIFLPDGFYGSAEEDIPPWLQRWCQHLLETMPKQEHPTLYEGWLCSEQWSKEFHLHEARQQIRVGTAKAEETQWTKDRNRMQWLQRSSKILLPDVVAGCLILRDFATATRWAYMALGIYAGITRDYRETEREMWNQYWWLYGIGQLGDRLHLEDFVYIRKPTREEVQRFQEEWKWEMVHATDQDPYQPVQVNKDGETLILPNATCERNSKSTQDQVIAKSLSTIGPLNISMGHFQDRSMKAPPGIVNKPELESIDDAQEDT